MSAIKDIYEKKDSFYLEQSSTLRGGVIFCIVVGLITFTVSMFSGMAERALGSLLFNVFFFFGISLISVAFSGMQDVIGATWGRPIKKLHESFASFLPVATVILAVFLLCISAHIGKVADLYLWIRDPDFLHHFPGKDIWLQPNFMVARDIVALLVICFLSSWQLRQVKARDRLFMDGKVKQSIDEGKRVQQRLRYWSAPILVTYSLAFSLLGFDLLMSLSPAWFSTLWGGWLFAIAMQTFFATLLIFMFSLKSTQLGQVIERQQFHDVGKLLYGFTVFFAYLTYAHILTYWYGNIPEETEYFLHRLHGPWLWIVLIAPIFNFLIPLYALIPKAAKWTPGYTHFLCFSILVAQWFVFMLVVMPDVIKVEHMYIPYIEFGIFLGILGLFLGSVFRYGRRTPLLGVGDPLLYDHLSSSGHH